MSIRPHRTGLRLFFLVLLLPAALLLWAEACLSQETVTMACSVPPTNLDPHRPTGPEAQKILFPCFDRLVSLQDESRKLIPSLALTWRESKDGRIYTFVLKQGFLFSNDKPVDAQAVFESFKRAFSPGMIGPEAFPNLVELEMLGPQTIRFFLKEPDPTFLPALASAAGSIVSPPDPTSSEAPNRLESLPWGGGIYRIVSWSEDGEIVLKARKGLTVSPPIEKFRFVHEPDPRKRIEMLLEGRAEIIEDVPPDQAQRLAEEESVALLSTPGRDLFYVALNCRKPNLKKTEVRRALSLGLDRETLAEEGRKSGLAAVYRPFIQIGPPADPERFRPEEAENILAQKWIGPRKLRVLFNPRSFWPFQAPNLIRQQLEDLGFEVEIIKAAEDRFDEALSGGRFDLALLSAETPRPGYLELFKLLIAPAFKERSENTAFFENPELEELYLDFQNALNWKTQLAAADKLEEFLLKESPYLFVFRSQELLGLSARLKNFKVHPLNPGAFPLAALSLGPVQVPEKELDEEEAGELNPKNDSVEPSTRKWGL